MSLSCVASLCLCVCFLAVEPSHLPCRKERREGGAGGRRDQEGTGCILAASRKPNLGSVSRTKVQVPKVFPVRPSSFVLFFQQSWQNIQTSNRLRPRCRLLRFFYVNIPHVALCNKPEQKRSTAACDFFFCVIHTIWHRKEEYKVEKQASNHF